MAEPTRCPACGASNQCAQAGASTSPCWCFEATIDPARLAALPEHLRNAQCLCPRCAGVARHPQKKRSDAP